MVPKKKEIEKFEIVLKIMCLLYFSCMTINELKVSCSLAAITVQLLCVTSLFTRT